MEYLNVTIGVVGHVDHGKTSLVYNLSGFDTDYLKEEKQRGLTIKPGHTFLQFEDKIVGLIDNPGHDSFIRNMVAGVVGATVGILVVAADDGIMPQTNEHLQIMEILGVRTGIIALTKIDRASLEQIEQCKQSIGKLVEGTFLEGAEIIEVDNNSRVGIDRLRNNLQEILSTVQMKIVDAPFRMAVERCFSAQGFGTIVGGVPLSGAIEVGEEIELLPKKIYSTVRGIQCCGNNIEKAIIGRKSALNLSKITLDNVKRGAIIATPNIFKPIKTIFARIKILQDVDEECLNNKKVQILFGTSSVICRIYCLDILSKSNEKAAVLILEEAIIIAPNDKVVIRSLSPNTTIGGGSVIEVFENNLRKREVAKINIEECFATNMEMKKRILFHLNELKHGITIDDLTKLLYTSRKFIESDLQELSAQKEIIIDGDFCITSSVEDLFCRSIKGCISKIIKQYPENIGVTKAQIMASFKYDIPTMKCCFNKLLLAGDLWQSGEYYNFKENRPQLSIANEKLTAELLSILEQEGIVTQTKDVLQHKLAISNKSFRKLIDLLVQRKLIVEVNTDTYCSAAALAFVKEKFVEYIHANKVHSGMAIKEVLNISRKQIVTYLEYLDRSGFTVVDKDFKRSLNSNYKKDI